jgi:pimeloyl-ACP methyl ester carboxylesterase
MASVRTASTHPAQALAGPDSRFLDVDGVSVHHRVTGPADAPTVLLFHHFYGNVATWRHVHEALSDDLRVVSFDRVGFGLTERPPRSRWRGTNPYTRQMSARIALALLDDLGAESASLIGSSAGGTAALETYRRAPSRIRGMALLSPAITGDVGAPRPFRSVLRTWPLRSIGTRIVRRVAGDITRERVSRSWHDPSRAGDGDVDAYARAMQVDGWDRGFWEVMTAEAPPDLRGIVQTVQVPTLVVAGASDRIIRPHWNRRTAAALPQGQFHLLEDTGHTPHEERPDLLVPVLRGFFAELHGS